MEASTQTFLELQLTPEQQLVVEALVRSASKIHQNLVFVATGSPRWRNDKLTWTFQIASIPASLGTKILKLIKNSA